MYLLGPGSRNGEDPWVQTSNTWLTGPDSFVFFVAGNAWRGLVDVVGNYLEMMRPHVIPVCQMFLGTPYQGKPAEYLCHRIRKQKPL